MSLRPHWMPNLEQELLLKSALLDPEEAICAWESWSSTSTIFQLGLDTSRILPLVWRNLHRHVDSSCMPILKGLYRSTWCKNQIRINHIFPILTALKESNVRISFLKGTALTLEYYQDFGLRPMADIDLMVSEKELGRAELVMKSQGWDRDKKGSLEELVTKYHGVAFTKPNCKDLDLHWRFSWDFTSNFTDQVWRRTKTTTFQNLALESLDPADLLFHVLIHGSRIGYRNTFNPQPRVIHWIPDAIEIIRNSKIDWSQLSDSASITYTRPQVYTSLSYLKTIFAAPIPDNALRELTHKPFSRAENFRCQAAMYPDRPKFFKTLSYLSRVSTAQIVEDRGMAYLDQIGFQKQIALMLDCLRRRFNTNSILTALLRGALLAITRKARNLSSTE